MALDTIAINYLVKEFNEKLINARIEKIHQPERDEILLIIKSLSGIFRLVISANASAPRIHFTSVQKENPKTAPMFCMLLRKHLQSGKIISISQIDHERIIRFDIESYDEFGDLTKKHLFCEIMGRHSNIILTKDDMSVIDSIKHIDFSLSSVRQILPGLSYCPPPAQNKTAILSDAIKNVCFDFSCEGISAEKEILAKVSGISPMLAREAVYKATNKINTDCSQLLPDEKKRIGEEIKKILSYKFCPCILIEESSSKIIDFSVFDITQYGNSVKKECFSTVNELLDDFYKERDNTERMKQKSADIIHILNTNIDRCAKKIAILKKTLEDASKKENYKINGDLLTSNLYKFSQGDSEVTLENYYDANMGKIKILLDQKLSPSQNAQRYYKLYQKAKNAQVEADKQLKNALCDLEYLESTLVLTQNAISENELNEIRTELLDIGYLKRKSKKEKQKKAQSKPHHFISSDGFSIYVGKNNTQNDQLTLRFANSGDLWFHTKNIHGSHTVIKLGINKDVPPQTIKEAAMLCAYFSKAKNSSNVPVDYTTIKNVKKPNGAKPGMVIYDNYNTVYVNPAILPKADD